jgi:alpha-L-fucosidase 2
MKIILFIILVLCAIVPEYSKAQNTSSVKLWYHHPADASVKDDSNGWRDDPEWLKSLPLGNGSLGAMVFGDANKERIQLNEKSLWSGSPAENDKYEYTVG